MSRVLALILAIAASAAAPASAGGEERYRSSAGRYSVYLNVMPAEFILGPLPRNFSGTLPQTPHAGRDSHHVVVSIFDSASGMRIGSFKVRAQVTAVGVSDERRNLEPIAFAGQAVYANSFPMPGRGPFQIDVQFEAHDRKHRQEVTFYFTHPDFAPPAQSMSKGIRND